MRGEDLVFKSYKGMFVYSYVAPNTGRTMYNVRCSCGKLRLLLPSVIRRHKGSCRCKPQGGVVIEEGVAYIDCSTSKLKDKILKMDSCLYLSLYKGKTFSAYNSGYSTLVYVKCVELKTSIHRLVNGTPFGLDTDHIDGDTLNNCAYNLRSVTKAENGRNASLQVDNTSGTVGVSWRKEISKWSAYITIDRKRKYLGTYADKAGAIQAREDGNLLYGFHENHGKR